MLTLTRLHDMVHVGETGRIVGFTKAEVWSLH